MAGRKEKKIIKNNELVNGLILGLLTKIKLLKTRLETSPHIVLKLSNFEKQIGYLTVSANVDLLKEIKKLLEDVEVAVVKSQRNNNYSLIDEKLKRIYEILMII